MSASFLSWRDDSRLAPRKRRSMMCEEKQLFDAVASSASTPLLSLAESHEDDGDAEDNETDGSESPEELTNDDDGMCKDEVFDDLTGLGQLD